MFYDDHNPPHFHVQYGEYKAAIRINDFALMEGYLPPKAMGLVNEWATLHKSELHENWEFSREALPLKKIEPLN